MIYIPKEYFDNVTSHFGKVDILILNDWIVL